MERQRQLAPGQIPGRCAPKLPCAPIVTFVWGFTVSEGGKTESGKLAKFKASDRGRL